MEVGVVYYVALVSIFVIGIIAGGVVVFFARRMLINRQIRIAERKAARMIAEARLESKNVLSEAKQEAEKTKSAAEADYRERRSQLQNQENRLAQKTESLERKLEGLEHRERNLGNQEKKIESTRSQLEEVRNRQLRQLELISSLGRGTMATVVSATTSEALRWIAWDRIPWAFSSASSFSLASHSRRRREASSCISTSIVSSSVCFASALDMPEMSSSCLNCLFLTSSS